MLSTYWLQGFWDRCRDGQVGGDDADRRDEPGRGFGGRASHGHRLQEPELLAARPGLRRVEGIHCQAQEGGRRRAPLNLKKIELFYFFEKCFSRVSLFSRPVKANRYVLG